MPIHIKSEETDRLARRLVAATGENLTEAITIAIRERLVRIEGIRSSNGLRDDIVRMQDRLATLPRLDDRGDEGILDYDESGLPS